jgi:HK97 gp10 family phage protein
MSDTGRLASSIEFDQIAPLTATVGSNIVYAVHLEYGTRKMAPRPFFRPAVEKMRPEFNKRLEAALAEVLR